MRVESDTSTSTLSHPPLIFLIKCYKSLISIVILLPASWTSRTSLAMRKCLAMIVVPSHSVRDLWTSLLNAFCFLLGNRELSLDFCCLYADLTNNNLCCQETIMFMIDRSCCHFNFTNNIPKSSIQSILFLSLSCIAHNQFNLLQEHRISLGLLQTASLISESMDNFCVSQSECVLAVWIPRSNCTRVWTGFILVSKRKRSEGC